MLTDPYGERFKRRLPRVFVGICAYGDIRHEAFESFMLWWGITCAKYKGELELFFGVSPKKEQYRARNHLVQSAEKQGADFLLMLDDDQLPHICPNLVGRFFEAGKPVAGGLYYQRGGCFHPVVMKEQEGPNGRTHYRFMHPTELDLQNPQRVDVVGHGCQWTDMEVFALLKQPHHWPYPEDVVFVPDETMGLDVHFCRRAKELGYEVWLLPNCHIGHLSNEPKAIDYRTRPPQAEIEQTGEYQRYLAKVYGNGTNRRVVEAA